MQVFPRIRSCKGVYGPREDSELLADAVSRYAFGNMLDLGTGTGIAGITAAMRGCAVTFADINPNAIECAKANASANQVDGKFIVSDMFSGIEGKFDTIAFNPPYLPSGQSDGAKGDIALDGGVSGRELIDIFLSGFKEHVSGRYAVLLLESSLNGYESDANRLGAEIVATKSMFFEELAVLLIR